MALIWWEKTVEYYFIQKCLEIEKLFLAPLDGNHERAGDTIFAKDHQWILIEFKKDEESIKSEKKKFHAYENAKKALQTYDSHHYLIYGMCHKDKFKILIRTYFSKRLFEIDKIFDQGLNYTNFCEYIQKFIEFKHRPKYFNDSNGSSSYDYALVAGIANNTIVECMSLSEFTSGTGLTLNPKEGYTETVSYGRQL